MSIVTGFSVSFCMFKYVLQGFKGPSLKRLWCVSISFCWTQIIKMQSRLPSCLFISKSVSFILISTIKLTRCTSVSNLFYFAMTLYMFRTVFPSIIMSSRLYVQQQTDTGVCLLANRQQYLFDKCLLLYVQSWKPDDGWKDRPKRVECRSKIK